MCIRDRSYVRCLCSLAHPSDNCCHLPKMLSVIQWPVILNQWPYPISPQIKDFTQEIRMRDFQLLALHPRLGTKRPISLHLHEEAVGYTVFQNR